mmetsp:Transcript_59295/g.166963  ORF Transcript_59295/g.166963 Transcript_59295/m.166963 type:complete len:584 (-) Transcript_59295:15-1766(-)
MAVRARARALLNNALGDFGTLRSELDAVTHGKGTKVIIQIFCTYFFFCKAIARDFVINSLTVYFTEHMHTSANLANDLATAARQPFGMKPLWGAMSDVFPVCGYHKRWYIVQGVATACLCATILSKDWVTSYSVATLLFIGFEYGGAVVDSCTQARYTELMKRTGKATIVSFAWMLIQVCGIFGAFANLLLSGSVQQRLGLLNLDGSRDLLILIRLAIPCTIPMLLPAILNFIQEEPAASFCTPSYARISQHTGIFKLCMGLSLGVVLSTGLLVFQAPLGARLAYNVALSVAVFWYSFQVLPHNIAKPNLYSFLCNALQLYFMSPLQIFYTGGNAYGLPHGTEGPPCIPDGPGFSSAHYQFVGTFAGAVAGSVGVYIFQRTISHWPVRKAFWVTTVFKMGATFLDLVILERWNHRLLGTTPGHPESQWVDEWCFVVGATAIEKIVEMLDFLPGSVMIGKLCPRNMEATVFAVLAASANFGLSIANINGTIFLEAIGVSFRLKTGECSQSGLLGLRGLSWGRIVGGVLLPALTIPLTFVLLPDIRLDEDFLGEEPDVQHSSVELAVSEHGSSVVSSNTRMLLKP